MKTEFVENYSNLSDMVVGDIAISKDRKSFFVCGYYYDLLKKGNVKVILDMNDLSYQYSETRNDNLPIKILQSGDEFICKR